MILGALLDLEIIDGSDRGKSLDDVVNQLYYQFYQKKGKGIVAEDLKKAAEKASVRHLYSFFSDCVYGTIDLDMERYFHSAGIGLFEIKNFVNARSIGMKVNQENYGLHVTSVKRGGSAYNNGIYVGDELNSINGYPIYEENLNSLIDQFRISEKVTFLMNRNGIVERIELHIRKDEMVSYTYEILDNKTRQQEKVYKTWLGK